MVRHVAPNGAVYHEPPYTEAEERDFYERTGNGIVGVMRKSAEDLALIAITRRLADDFRLAAEDSAEQAMIRRQLEGIRNGSELGSILVDEVDCTGSVCD